MIGRILSHFRITAKLGQGGMGEVYRATDTKLDREVAIKLMPGDFAESPERLARFEREAKAVAALDHANIVRIYSVEEDEGIPFFTMELVPGTGLDQAIPEGGFPLERFAELALQLTDGLGAAHEAGVVHRDLKPGNLRLTPEGRLKILDFGLAKLREPVETQAPDSEVPTALLTEEGRVLGTPAYMAPEQALGDFVDARADVFALGAVLYEMLLGARPFSGASRAEVREAILESDPALPHEVRPEIPRELERVLLRCLAKRPEDRFENAEEVHRALRAALSKYVDAEPSRTALSRPLLVTGALGLVLVLALGAWFLTRVSRQERARRETLPRIEALLDESRHVEAFLLAIEVEPLLAEDPHLEELMARASEQARVVTDPPGAEVYYRDYRTAEMPWQHVGRSPLPDQRLPAAFFLRWRVEKEGFEPLEVGRMGRMPVRSFELVREGEGFPGMLLVPAGTQGFGAEEPKSVPAFWLGRFEVTNRQYQEFVDAGGYRNPEYWREAMEAEELSVGFEELVRRFVDSTGRPGPSSWSLGRFPEGRGDHPVGGVSWFEAVAYASFAGAHLPTVYHWRLAAPFTPFGDMLLLSNFGADDSTPVGGHSGVGPYGHDDLAGNVSEWCWNRAADGRYQLGGSWRDPSYIFSNNVAYSPFDRSQTMGFRLARYVEPPDAELTEPAGAVRFDFAAVEPVGDEVFSIYRGLFDYSPGALDARLESVDDSGKYWRRETVSFNAAYGDERMLAHLFLPHDVSPPYQAVVYSASSAARVNRSIEAMRSDPVFFIPRSGRALVWPALKGMLERGGGEMSQLDPRSLRDRVLQSVNDIQRTVDYLETREDIDGENLGYFGLSAGAEYGPVYTAIEQRFRAIVLLAGGFDDVHMLREPGEISPWNYAPRVAAPTLMINGRSDYAIPVETGQEPLFELLGVPEGDKRHVILEGGHLPFDLNAVIRETLDWYDRYLGPVR